MKILLDVSLIKVIKEFQLKAWFELTFQLTVINKQADVENSSVIVTPLLSLFDHTALVQNLSSTAQVFGARLTCLLARADPRGSTDVFTPVCTSVASQVEPGSDTAAVSGKKRLSLLMFTCNFMRSRWGVLIFFRRHLKRLCYLANINAVTHDWFLISNSANWQPRSRQATQCRIAGSELSVVEIYFWCLQSSVAFTVRGCKATRR